jgi:glycosyltransferase involved in cell wall biosynthesis
VQGCSPIKLFEYMAAAKPIVATDLPCVREIIDHERTGLLVRHPTAKNLATALEQVAATPSLADELGRRARRTVVSEATWSRRHSQLKRFYTDLARA